MFFVKDLYQKKKPLFKNRLALAYFDEFPASKGHILIITKRHAVTFFDTTKKEKIAMIELLDKCKKYIDKNYQATGYNVGVNCDKDAAESVMHVHIHLIPRYNGDAPIPQGIRAVLTDKEVKF